MNVFPRFVIVGLMVLTASPLLTGCKDQEKCDEAVATSRKAMQDAFLDMALARKWRDHAGKICGAGAELTALDQEIVAREAALTKAAEDKLKAEAEAGTAAMLAVKKLYKKWDGLDSDKQSKQSLKTVRKKALKIAEGLPQAYATQVQAYDKKQASKRQKTLKDRK